MVILSLVATATLVFVLAAGTLYPDGIVHMEQPGGDLTLLDEFRPAFLFQLAVMVFAIGAATYLASTVVSRRIASFVGLALILATTIVGAATVVSGDWLTYAVLVTLPAYPWAFGWPVYALLALAALSWAVAVGRRVRLAATAVGLTERASTVREALLTELWPAFAGARQLGAVAERAWLATELHATVLPAIRSAVEVVGPSGTNQADVRSRLTRLETEIRRIADGKRSILLDEFGLEHAIEALVERVQSEDKVPIYLQVLGDTDLGRPPRRVEQAALDICRLALDNAVRHSGSSEIQVVLGTAGDRVHLEVSDQGRGLVPSEVEAASRSRRHGILDMHQAARSVSGRLVVDTASGTRVIFDWHESRRAATPALK
jgi:signal transduction histidine kinase